MLDKINQRIVKVLNKMCDSGASYKILSLSDIIANVGKKYNLDGETLSKNLNFLSDCDFIDVKYIDEKDVCLCLLSKARVHEEEREIEKKEKIKYYKLALITSVSSIISAFLGGLLAFLILGR